MEKMLPESIKCADWVPIAVGTKIDIIVTAITSEDILISKKIGSIEPSDTPVYTIEPDAEDFMRIVSKCGRLGSSLSESGRTILQIYFNKYLNAICKEFGFEPNNLCKDCSCMYNVFKLPLDHIKMLARRGEEFFINTMENFIEIDIDASKEKQVLGIPAVILQAMGQEKMYNALRPWQILAKYANDNSELVQLHDVLAQLSEDVEKSSIPVKSAASVLLSTIASIVELTGSRPKSVLTYIFRYVLAKIPEDSIPEYTDFRNVAIELCDTLKIQSKLNIPCELPSRLFYEHATLARNDQVLRNISGNQQEAMIKAIANYSQYCFSDKEYTVIVPASHKDLVQEGCKLRHCVASYVEKITEGLSYVFFVRKNSSKEEPFVTVEIDPTTLAFVQIKQFGDEDVSDLSVLAFIETWGKEITRLKEEKTNGEKIYEPAGQAA